MIEAGEAAARALLERIGGIPTTSQVTIMNVCGGHERSLSMLGLRTALPEHVQVIPGPGCPVCVCPEEDLADAIAVAMTGDVTLVAFGDMLRVPINVSKGDIASLAQARTAGADVRPISSPQEAVAIARSLPGKPVVFFVAGFETTTAPVAAMLMEGVPDNLSILLAARRTWPAVAMLLRAEDNALDALIAPGHVATVMGADEWRFVANRHHLPVAVAGFSAESLLAGIYSVLRQFQEGIAFLDNCYQELVRPEGNRNARRMIAEVMAVTDARWRGIGIIPDSGFSFRGPWQHYDARMRHAIVASERRHPGDMPPGCDCARVVLGKVRPNECRLYGKACTPQRPIGPCMVSDEGACHIWWQAGIRTT